jgi:hypothetical protein
MIELQNIPKPNMPRAIEQSGNTLTVENEDGSICVLNNLKLTKLQWLDGKSEFTTSKLGAPGSWAIVAAEKKEGKYYLSLRARETTENKDPDYWQKYQVFTFDEDGANCKILTNISGGNYFSENQYKSHTWIDKPLRQIIPTIERVEIPLGSSQRIIAACALAADKTLVATKDAIGTVSITRYNAECQKEKEYAFSDGLGSDENFYYGSLKSGASGQAVLTTRKSEKVTSDRSTRYTENITVYTFANNGLQTSRFTIDGRGNERILDIQIGKDGVAWLVVLTDSQVSLGSTNYNLSAPIDPFGPGRPSQEPGQDILVVKIDLESGAKSTFRVGTDDTDYSFGGKLNDEKGEFILSMNSKGTTPKVNGNPIAFEKPFSTAPKYSNSTWQYFLTFGNSASASGYFFNSITEDNVKEYAQSIPSTNRVNLKNNSSTSVENIISYDLSGNQKATFERNQFIVFDTINTDVLLASDISSYATRYKAWTVSLSEGQKLSLVGTGYEFGATPAKSGDNIQSILLTGPKQSSDANEIQLIKITLPLDSQPSTSTYSLTPSKAAINEGDTLTTTVKTTGVAKDTTLYWEITGSGVDANDFVAAVNPNPLRGEGKVDAKGEFKFSHTLKNDLTLNEGDESLQVKLYSASTRTAASQLGATLSVKVNDTSKRTYSLTPSKAAINEGDTLTTTVKTTGVAKDTTLYWEITGSGVDANDFVAAVNPNPLRGEGKVDAKGEFKFSHTLKNDLSLNEGDESLQVKLYSASSRAAASQIGATTSITVVDSSKSQNNLPTVLTPKWSTLIDSQLWDIQLSQDESQVIGAGQRGFTAIAAGVKVDKGAEQWTSPVGNNYYRATRVEKAAKDGYLVGASATDSNKTPIGAAWQKLDNQGNATSISNISNATGKVYGVTAGFARANNFIDIFNNELAGRTYQPCIRINEKLVVGRGTPELLVHCATINQSGDTVYAAGWEKGNRAKAAIYKATLGANSASWSKIGDITTASITGEELNINSMELDESSGALVLSGDIQSYSTQSSYGLIGELNTSTGTPSIQQVRLAGLMGGGNSTDSISSIKILNDQYLLAAGFESTKSQEVQGKLYLLNRQTKAIDSRTIELPDTKWDLVRDIEIDSDGNIFAAGAGVRALGNIATIFPGKHTASIIRVTGEGGRKGTPRGDIFIMDSSNHSYPILDGNGGRDRYYLSEDVNARNKLPHSYPEGGGSPFIEIQADDSVFLPSGVAPKDIIFWNTFSSRAQNYSSTELVYDPNGLYRQLFAPSSRFSMTWFEGDILVGGGVSDNNGDGIADDGDPRARGAYDLRRNNPEGYKAEQQRLASKFAQRPSWLYETDRLATLSMKDSTGILDIASRIFQSDGIPAFAREKATSMDSFLAPSNLPMT